MSKKHSYEPLSYALLKDGRIGQIRWSGSLRGRSGYYVGLQLMNATGKHDGTYKGNRLFRCKPQSGVFTREEKIVKIVPLNSDWRELTGEKIEPHQPYRTGSAPTKSNFNSQKKTTNTMKPTRKTKSEIKSTSSKTKSSRKRDENSKRGPSKPKGVKTTKRVSSALSKICGKADPMQSDSEDIDGILSPATPITVIQDIPTKSVATQTSPGVAKRHPSKEEEVGVLNEEEDSDGYISPLEGEMSQTVARNTKSQSISALFGEDEKKNASVDAFSISGLFVNSPKDPKKVSTNKNNKNENEDSSIAQLFDFSPKPVVKGKPPDEEELKDEGEEAGQISHSAVADMFSNDGVSEKSHSAIADMFSEPDNSQSNILNDESISLSRVEEDNSYHVVMDFFRENEDEEEPVLDYKIKGPINFRQESLESKKPFLKHKRRRRGGVSQEEIPVFN